MYPTFGGLETARRALFAHRMAIDVTGHNLANVDTPGYRRQRAQLVATPPAPGNFQPGTGVMVGSIERLRDQFIDTQIRSTMGSLGRWEARAQVLEEMQEVFKEPSEIGLSAMMDQFWISWQELSVSSKDPSRRTAVQQEATSLASAFNLVAVQLSDMTEDIKNNISAMYNRVNVTGESIAAINREIIRAKVVGENVSDLYDKRDLLIEQLAMDVDLSVVEDPNGAVNITVGGRVLVSGSEARKVGDDTPVTGGRIKGLLEMVNNNIPRYMRQLDDLANSLMSAVNAVHAGGYDIHGVGGGVFFEGEGQGARGIKLADAIARDPGLIAAADSADDSGPGNGLNAMRIAQLKDALTMNGGIATFRDFYGALITGIGLDTSESKRSGDVFEGVLEQQTMRREAVSGVDIDEEILTLIKQQSSYSAAARLVTAIDEMLDTIINGTGIIGRR